MEALKILVIEDEPGDVRLLEEYLGAGPTALYVDAVATLADAIALVNRKAYDAVILDLNLPDGKGTNVLRTVRQAYPAPPIIITSSVVPPSLRLDLLAHGADEVFDKDEVAGKLFPRSVFYMIERSRARARHAELEQLLESTPDAIVVVNSSNVVRYVNHATLLLFNVSRASLVGEHLGFSVEEGKPVEIEVPRRGGTRICEMRVVSLDWQGERALLASIRDVTEQKLAEQLRARSAELEEQNHRIQEASRLKSQFLANMSHELRTPLNAIIGFSQILHAGAVDPSSPRHHEFLGDILASSKHLLQLINDVLDLAKVEAGKMEFRPEFVDLAKLIGEVVAGVAPLIRAGRIRVDVELDREPALKDVHLDPGRFKQVLYNYLSNAIKFTPEGGRATIRIRKDAPAWFRLEVHDTGIGIAPEDLGKLFVEFQQLHSGIAKVHQGTGLGLALTRRIVEAQGGHVGVTSDLGKGSLFFAVLPLRGE